MNYILKVISSIIPKELPKPMGRWNIDYCSVKLNHKIDLSNEDHCGPCGQYAYTKNRSIVHINSKLNPKDIIVWKPSNIIFYKK